MPRWPKTSSNTEPEALPEPAEPEPMVTEKPNDVLAVSLLPPGIQMPDGKSVSGLNQEHYKVWWYGENYLTVRSTIRDQKWVAIIPLHRVNKFTLK